MYLIKESKVCFPRGAGLVRHFPQLFRYAVNDMPSAHATDEVLDSASSLYAYEFGDQAGVFMRKAILLRLFVQQCKIITISNSKIFSKTR